MRINWDACATSAGRRCFIFLLIKKAERFLCFMSWRLLPYDYVLIKCIHPYLLSTGVTLILCDASSQIILRYIWKFFSFFFNACAGLLWSFKTVIDI